MSGKMTRRRFVTYTAIGLGAGAIAYIGLGTRAFRPPAPGYYRRIAADRDPAKPAVLVTYATKAGSTLEIAQALATELEQRAFTVDISPVERVTDLQAYRYVVLGSAIRMGRPLGAAVKFVEQHQETLRSVPTAFYAVHLMNTADDEASNAARRVYLDPLRSLVTPQHEAYFVGVFDPHKVTFLEGLMAKSVNSPVGDMRDWGAISAWGQAIFG